MIAQRARCLGSLLAAVVLTTACTHYYEIPIETPIRPKLDTSGFQRVLVAGFIAGGLEDVDGNLETTRLLRSQLRSKSDLRVIDADTLPLMEVVAADRAKASGEAPAALPPIKEDKDLEPYEPLFGNTTYWKQIGEEYQQPLIVTGTIMFTTEERSSSILRPVETRDQFGRRVFILKPRFIFIDGRTGETLDIQTYKEENSHNASQQTPALSSYFDLMDRLIPNILGTLSSQKVKGTRFLLQ